jgi:phospholipid N-methyltransferase
MKQLKVFSRRDRQKSNADRNDRKMAIEARASFLSQFFSKPRAIGSFSPSSPALAQKMVEGIDWSGVRSVIEYGPGTGAFTEAILTSVRPGTRFVAIEINPRFVEILKRRYPQVEVVHDDVGNVREICRREGLDEVDVIISALPWALFSPKEQVALLEATAAVLKPGGQFVTCALLQGTFLPSGQRFRRQLRQHFAHVGISKTAWANLPPAFAYRCQR